MIPRSTLGWRTPPELYAHNDNGRNKLSTPGGARILQLDKVTELNSDEPQEPIVDIDESKLKITIEDAAGLTIQQIREAATAQQLKELIAQGGERYVEMLSNIWGVKSDDVMQDRPRLIGHDHILLQQSQIANTNFTGTNNDTAFLSAFGQTQGITKTAKISVDEHCLIMSLLVIRNEQSYQNGVDQELTREHFEDYYNPMFEGISEQPIKKYEIMATANEEQNQETFGFQEYGARYKTEYNQIFGNFESADDTSLEQWHYADNYDTRKEIVLDQALLKVSQENVNRTIPVNSKTGKDQFLIAVWPKLTWERKMRTYSKPGIRKI